MTKNIDEKLNFVTATLKMKQKQAEVFDVVAALGSRGISFQDEDL